MSNPIIDDATDSPAEIDILSDLGSPQPPRMYNVVLLNDDFTPMEFVVAVLIEIFHKDLDDAKFIMLKVHYDQRGIAGTYTKEIAQEKAARTVRLARASHFPLNCLVEVAE